MALSPCFLTHDFCKVAQTWEQKVPEKIPPKSWEIDNLPNRLTFFRILLVPIVISTLMMIKANFNWVQPHLKFLSYLAAWTFVAASLTDILDGYIARRRKLVTAFGSFLDPIADKFLVVSSLIFLLALDRIHVLITVILVLREMYITSLRLLASTKGLSIQVGQFGRWKTICQMIAIPLLIAYDHPWGHPHAHHRHRPHLPGLASLFVLRFGILHRTD